MMSKCSKIKGGDTCYSSVVLDRISECCLCHLFTCHAGRHIAKVAIGIRRILTLPEFLPFCHAAKLVILSYWHASMLKCISSSIFLYTSFYHKSPLSSAIEVLTVLFEYFVNLSIHSQDILYSDYAPPPPDRSSGGEVVKLSACGARGPGFVSWPRRYDFRDWLFPFSKSRYG